MSETAEKRSVHTDALATLGTIIDSDAKRAAIHIAVEPAQAFELLKPGDNVGKMKNGMYHRAAETTVGIVDPFLTVPVQRNEWFWLLVYPRQITSLRHVWSHPAFEDDQPALENTTTQDSEMWLRRFCDDHDCPRYDTIMKVLMSASLRVHLSECDSAYIDGEYFHVNGMDAHADIPPEFWKHAEIVTGKSFGPNPPEYFTCSC